MTPSVSELNLPSIDAQLSEFGQFCVIDWLLQTHSLPYSEYELWRYERVPYLDDLIRCGKDELQELLNGAEALAAKLKLVHEEQVYYSWNSNSSVILNASSDSKRHLGLTRRWLRPKDLPQLDLFMDNSVVITENGLKQAMAARQFLEAQKKLDRLTLLSPSHARLGMYQDLINYGEHVHESPDIDQDYLAEELFGLENEVAPLARELLGLQARDYLAYAWRRLVKNLSHKSFDRSQPKLHQSYALAQIPDWKNVSEGLLHNRATFSESELLHRLCISFEQQKMLSHALVAWCLFFEHDREVAENAIEYRGGEIRGLWDDFTDSTEGVPPDYFPAYVFSVNPAMIHVLDVFPRFIYPATHATIELLLGRIQGHNELPYREAMQKISPALLRMYLNAKKGR